MATTLQGLKDIAKKVTGKTPVSNTENGALAEFADNYSAPQPPDLSEYAKKSDLPDMSNYAEKSYVNSVMPYVGMATVTGTYGVSEPEATFELNITAQELFDMVFSGRQASFVCKQTDFPKEVFIITITAVQVAPATGYYRIQAIRTAASNIQSYKTTLICLVGEAIAATSNVALEPVID